ncbi:MAG: Imm52 family immunity protein [Roseiarcus sp.]|jgi:hypothetical protein
MTILHLDFYWRSRHPSQADDARRLSRFVNGLPDFDPVYRSWVASPETKEQTVPVPLSEGEAKRLLIENVMRYDLPSDPWPERGSYIWGGHAGPPPYDFREASVAVTRCYIGAYGDPARSNSIEMGLSDVRPSTGRPWRASELRPLMKFAREVWRPAEMSATLTFFDPQKIPDSSWAGGERTLEPRIGWITYLPPNLAARAKYPADVAVETLADGAVLVTLCEEPFGKGDAAGLARLHALEAALRPIQS